MKNKSLLTRNQRESIGLLQIGTFLEYFDLMLYVHMAFLLNELFFPKTDSHTAMLLSAFAFCSTYVLRPVGALIFGYIGDQFGRKITVIMTSMLMGLSCVLMANLPTYEQIGITAAWGITLCRVLQSLSSQGEIIGAEIYLMEITKPPLRYPVVSLTSFFAAVGGMCALGLSVLLTTFEINWRLAFWIGAGISSIGFTARIALRETPEFIHMKRLSLQAANKQHRDEDNKGKQEKINARTVLAYFLISCGYPICFYLSYIYCGNILKNTYGYTAEQVIQQNFILSIFQCVSFLTYSLLSYKINPLKILKIRLLIFVPVILFYPYLLNIIQSPFELLMFQVFLVSFSIIDVPAAGIMMNHFPVLKRFTSTSLIYSFSRMTIYIVTSFGFIYLTDYFDHWGIWLFMLIFCAGFYWGIKHFEQLEGLQNSSQMIYSFGINKYRMIYESVRRTCWEGKKSLKKKLKR